MVSAAPVLGVALLGLNRAGAASAAHARVRTHDFSPALPPSAPSGA